MYKENDIYKDLKNMMLKILDNAPMLNSSLVKRNKISITKKIKIKGDEEQFQEKPPHQFKQFYEIRKEDFKTLVNKKIFYVQQLFELVDESNLIDFYIDLNEGLDYVIEIWDASGTNPKQHKYKKSPVRAKKFLKYKKK